MIDRVGAARSWNMGLWRRDRGYLHQYHTWEHGTWTVRTVLMRTYHWNLHLGESDLAIKRYDRSRRNLRRLEYHLERNSYCMYYNSQILLLEAYFQAPLQHPQLMEHHLEDLEDLICHDNVET